MSSQPRFFTNASEWRDWLRKNHQSAREIWLGFYNKTSKRGGLSIREAVDQALCFGWIDGKLKKSGTDSFIVRFTPRRRGSVWSETNVRNARHLIRAGLMRPPGLAAFKLRDRKRTKEISLEERRKGLSKELVREFQANAAAWTFFREQPQGYQNTMTFWVMNGKREQTRRKRLERVISVSARGKRVDLLAPYKENRMV